MQQALIVVALVVVLAGGKTTTTSTHRFSVSTLDLPAWLPSLAVGAESLLGGLGRALGMQDIELESVDFNDRFRVRSEDAQFASAVLAPRLMQALLAVPGSPAFQIQNGALWCADPGKQEPADITRRLELLRMVAEAIPSFVWKDHGAGG